MVKLVTTFRDPDTDAPLSLMLDMTFEQVFDKIYPINPPASNLEARQNFLFTLEDGSQLAIHNNYVAMFYESDGEE